MNQHIISNRSNTPHSSLTHNPTLDPGTIMISDNSAVRKLSESVLPQIWQLAPKKSIELYPLIVNPNIQLVPGVYKNHLHGLFYELEQNQDQKR